ncbi:MAG: tRNA (N6-isopentenyl adenosine(37)-C2)-methylthiotransferase MiaB [Candidatus Magasanikbacteria bacterium]|nr:tRNA (N6-isopentenyl adenosine(37)-C2)-methylthiotransferase MiaB [Candidatus Magasanikbacteria bacterium]
MRRYYILTMGCQMNKNDSERIAGFLSSLGYVAVERPEDGNLLIINTCSVRQAAEDRVCGIVRNWQALRRQKTNMIIAITGCMPGRDESGKLRRRIPGVDLWFGIDELPRLPVWLKELNVEQEKNFDYLNIKPMRESHSRAFITIQTGCNNFCTYCVVPNARGRERNRSLIDILNEVRNFVVKGGLEVTLLGQVVNHYIAPDPESFSKENPFLSDHFAALLWELNQIAGLERLHFTAPDPQYFNAVQAEALKLPKQMNYIHLPAQSGDNEILRKMNRRYTREQYVEIVKKIRVARPNMAVGADLMVGFCGETDEQFNNTLDLYKECDLDISYNAKYSERSGTPAAKAFKDDVSREIKKRRWEELQEIMEAQALRKNQIYVGSIVEVLVENCEQGICSGNSREMKLVNFLGEPNLVDTIVRVKIFEAKEWVLKGKII